MSRADNLTEYKAQVRQQVLTAAQVLFARDGYKMTSLGSIAAEVGIGRTTLYEYFTDKEDLVATLVEETLPNVIEDVVRAARSEDRIERFVGLAVGMVDFISQDPVLGLLLHTEVPKMSDKAQQRVAVAHRGLSAEFGAVYRAGVEAGVLKPLPPRLVGRFAQDIIMSAARAVIEAEDPKQASPAITAAMVTVLLSGFAV